MRYLFILLVFMLAFNSLNACLYATQNRLFPIGSCSMGLCVFETHLERTEFSEEGEEILEFTPAWGGATFFRIYDENHKVVYSKRLARLSMIQEKYYIKTLSYSFRKAQKHAESFADYIAATPVALSFCNFNQTCSLAELRFDYAKPKVEIQLANQKSYPLSELFDTASIASNLLLYYLQFDDDFISVESFQGLLGINSFRQFQVGGRVLYVAHIGAGQNYEDLKGTSNSTKKASPAGFSFNHLEKSIFEEDLLHHGHGFDFFIWE